MKPRMNLTRRAQMLVAAGIVSLAGFAYTAVQNLFAEPAIKTSQSSTNVTSENSQPTSYRVELCTDGDTCRLIDNTGKKIRVRLVGIDAPETRKGKQKQGQPFALEAKDYLNQQIQGQNVRIRSYGTDVYERTLGEIFLGERNLNLELVSKGFAEMYRGRPPSELDAQAYQQAQATAQKSKLGIWSQLSYQSPKDYRKRHKH